MRRGIPLFPLTDTPLRWAFHSDEITMDVELIEIREFLAEHPPFSELPEELLDRLPHELTIRYLRRGGTFPPADVGDALYLIRRGALELRSANGELLERLGEGETVLCGCLDSAPAITPAQAIEDTLFYVISCERLHDLSQRSTTFTTHFEASVRNRLRRAIEALQQAPGGPLPLDIPVNRLTARIPVVTTPGMPIREAAQLMSLEGVSALLVMDREQLTGIVTDRDLRARCLAADRDPAEPVSAIMTHGVESIAHDAPAFEALLTMTRLNVHHLPVLEGTRVSGVISASDLVQYQSTNAVYLANDIRRADSAADLAEVCRRLPELQVQLVAAGITAHHLGQAVTTVLDTLTHRLIDLAEAELGEPPVPYIWLAGGSQGRREQTVHTDQDSALLLHEDYDPACHHEWFDTFTRTVTDGLAACGIALCPGDVMVRSPEWRNTAEGWRRALRRWVENPTTKAAMLATNFFDLRPIRGDAAAFERLHTEAAQMVAGNRIFLGQMVDNALKQKTPLGFFRHFVLEHAGKHAHTLDIKHRGLVPLADVARILALAAGGTEVGTRARLEGANEAGTLSDDGFSNLTDSLELLATLRLRHQTAAIRRGAAPDNYLDPRTLSYLEREHLKDAFSVVSEHQQLIAQVYGTGKLD